MWLPFHTHRHGCRHQPNWPKGERRRDRYVVWRSETASRASRTGDFQMARLFGLVGATVGSALGWWLGEHVGLMTAFLVSTAGTGAGLYFGRWIAGTYL